MLDPCFRIDLRFEFLESGSSSIRYILNTGDLVFIQYMFFPLKNSKIIKCPLSRIIIKYIILLAASLLILLPLFLFIIQPGLNVTVWIDRIINCFTEIFSRIDFFSWRKLEVGLQQAGYFSFNTHYFPYYEITAKIQIPTYKLSRKVKQSFKKSTPYVHLQALPDAPKSAITERVSVKMVAKKKDGTVLKKLFKPIEDTSKEGSSHKSNVFVLSKNKVIFWPGIFSVYFLEKYSPPPISLEIIFFSLSC